MKKKIIKLFAVVILLAMTLCSFNAPVFADDEVETVQDAQTVAQEEETEAETQDEVVEEETTSEETVAEEAVSEEETTDAEEETAVTETQDIEEVTVEALTPSAEVITAASEDDDPEQEAEEPKDISELKITEIKSSYILEGKSVTPVPVIKDGDKVLEKDVDYTLSYTDNKALGTAKITIIGIGDYTGSVEKSFKLKAGTGLYKVKDVWKYYENGKFTKIDGLVKRVSDGKKCYVEKGVFQPVTGLIKSNGKGRWRYVRKGVFNQATGLVKRYPDGKYFYAEQGVYKKVTGAATIVGKEKYYYVDNGARTKLITGLAQRLSDGQWAYFENGEHKTVTGVVSKYIDGKYRYVQKGIYKRSTGLAKRLSDGKWVYVKNGNYLKVTGIVPKISNGKFYYVKKGIYTKATGYAQRVSDGKWMYVHAGEYKGAMMTVKQYVDTLEFAASIKTRYWNQYPYNCGYMHEDGAVSWDCLNLVKTIINGWKYNETVGSFCNNFSNTGDCTEWGLLSQCGIISTDFSKLKYTAVLYMPGHIGTYIGKDVVIHGNTYNVIECTARWGGGVFYTYVDKYGGRYNHKGGTYLGSNWTHHGKMTEWLIYSTAKIK